MTKLKWIGLAITGILLVLVITLSVVVAKKNTAIHTYKYQVAQYEQTIDSLQKLSEYCKGGCTSYTQGIIGFIEGKGGQVNGRNG